MKEKLVSCVAMFDLMISTAMSFGSAPLPLSSFFWGAHGTQATCRAQGFFIQLGSVEVFYSAGLTTYFLMTIKYGKSETVLQRMEYMIHAPALLGLILGK